MCETGNAYTHVFVLWGPVFSYVFMVYVFQGVQYIPNVRKFTVYILFKWSVFLVTGVGLI